MNDAARKLPNRDSTCIRSTPRIFPSNHRRARTCSPGRITVRIQIDLKAQQNILDADKHLYEVVLTVTVTAKQNDQLVFLVEAQQGGVFTVEGSTPEMLEMLLEAACLTVLYPLPT